MSAPEHPLLAEVALDCPDRDAFTYLVPAELAEGLAVGDGVRIQFGPRRLRGFVIDLRRREPPPHLRDKLRPIAGRIAGLRLPPHQLALIRWASRYYRCPMGSFLTGVVPAGALASTTRRVERRIRRRDGHQAELNRRQREVLALLPLEAIPLAAACERAATTVKTLEALAAAGAAVIEADAGVREHRLDGKEERFAPTAEQAAAIEAIAAHLGRDHAVFLLHGVTGSGKTLVYQELAERVVAAGRQVLLLLPEIALTPQLAARFRRRFSRVVVWHSAFSDGERAEQWRQVATGEADLVIGTRSALFAPLPAPGLIIVDEEHDGSFKQDQAPRYHGRDLAVVHGRQLGVPVVLGTATPSLETYRNVQEGRYRVLLLRTRPTGGSLPQVRLVDMAEEARRRGGSVHVAQELVEGLREVRQRGEQAIVLLNRRGWSPVVSCLSCGQAIKCRACDISLTWHKGQAVLACHYCGHHQAMPQRCPNCDRPDLDTRGLGTEQLAALLARNVAGLRVLRLDADTVSTRQAHAQILGAFAQGEADCLVGTQMVAKGLDFPRVTLVGVVGADRGLSVPDFRAAERTFQLIAQVSGRAGRGERPGRVIVQAHDLGHPAIRCAAEQRLKTFYTGELDLRRRYGYPPCGGLIRVLWRSEDAAAVQALAEEQGERVRVVAAGCEVLGPTPAGIAFLQGKHRWHLLVKASSRGEAQALLDRLQAAGGLDERRGVQVALDVDPYVIN